MTIKSRVEKLEERTTPDQQVLFIRCRPRDGETLEQARDRWLGTARHHVQDLSTAFSLTPGFGQAPSRSESYSATLATTRVGSRLHTSRNKNRTRTISWTLRSIQSMSITSSVWFGVGVQRLRRAATYGCLRSLISTLTTPTQMSGMAQTTLVPGVICWLAFGYGESANHSPALAVSLVPVHFQEYLNPERSHCLESV